MLLSIQISFYNLVGDKLDEKRKRFLSISQDQSSFYIRTERRGKYTDTDTVTGVVSQSHCLFKVWFNLSWYGSDLEGTGCAGAGCVAWRSWCHVPRLSQDWTGPQLVASLWPLACPRPACLPGHTLVNILPLSLQPTHLRLVPAIQPWDVFHWYCLEQSVSIGDPWRRVWEGWAWLTASWGHTSQTARATIMQLSNTANIQLYLSRGKHTNIYPLREKKSQNNQNKRHKRSL